MGNNSQARRRYIYILHIVYAMSQSSALKYLHRHGRATAAQIATGTGLGIASVRNNLARLEKGKSAHRTGNAMIQRNKKGHQYYAATWEPLV